MYEDTGVLPAALESRPTLPKHFEYAYGIFNDLSSSRLPVMDGIGAIPYSEFFMYSVGLLTDKERREIWKEVKLIDSIYREEVMKNHKNQIGNTPKPQTSQKKPT